MVGIAKLIDGYKKFYQKYFVENQELYKNLVAHGQSPRTLMIACSDSRVDPSILTNAKPGEIFVIRNVANLVPPFQADSSTYHGTSAAIEFAVKNLNVENIVILGHSSCAGVNALVNIDKIDDKEFSFLKEWIKIGIRSRERVLINYDNYTIEEQCAICEKESLITSLENLLSYPWIKSRVESGLLDVIAWHFNLESGEITYFNNSSHKFEKLMV